MQPVISDVKKELQHDNILIKTLIQLITAFNVLEKMCTGVPDEGQLPKFSKEVKLQEAEADNKVMSLQNQSDELVKILKGIKELQLDGESKRLKLLDDIGYSYQVITDDNPRFSIQVQPQEY